MSKVGQREIRTQKSVIAFFKDALMKTGVIEWSNEGFGPNNRVYYFSTVVESEISLRKVDSGEYRY